MENLETVLDGIKGLDMEMVEKAWAHQRELTKPAGSLGRLEEVAVQICGIRRMLHPSVKRKRVVLFAGDHGVVEEGVSAYPKEVTSQMVYNFLKGGAAVNAFAKVVGAEVEIVDIGVDCDFGNMEGLISRKISRGTKNFTLGPAMTLEQCRSAIEIGIERAFKAYEDGVELLATGDMGIGNTTSSSALYCAYLGLDPTEVTGTGTGISEEQLEHKIGVIRKALKVNEHLLNEPLSILSALGGFEIAGICGLILGACYKRIPVVIDGFICSAGALCAIQMKEEVKELVIFGHLSAEVGHQLLFGAIGAKPVVQLRLRLGEGTGALLAMAIIELALSAHNNMATFSTARVSKKKDK